MALKDLKIPTADVKVGTDGSFAVRGLSTDDIQHLVRTFGDDLRALFNDFVNGQRPPQELLQDDAALKGIMAQVAQKIPGLIIGVLQLSANPQDEEDMAILRGLPAPVQIDALFKTVCLTLNVEGDLGKAIETVVMALGGLNGAIAHLNLEKLSR